MWTANQVDQAKIAIKAELDRIEEAQGRPARLQSILRELQAAADKHDDDNRLRSFVLIMSALVYHQRLGGLKDSQVSSLHNKAVAILQAQGIEPGRSRLAFLWGELHQVKSLIDRRNGEHWLAAWELQLGGYLSRPTKFHDSPFQSLAYANRSLRLGNARLAYQWYETASMAKQATVKEQALLGQVRCARLMGEIDLCLRLIENNIKASEDFSEASKREFGWEKLRIDHIVSDNFAPIFPQIQKKNEFHSTTFIVEAYLLAASLSSKDWMNRMRKMRTVARDKHLDTKRRQAEFNFALCIEDGYEVDVPLVNRLRNLGQHLSGLSEIPNIDKVLLAWAAATRWLIRSHAKPLAALTLREYRSLSMRLSDGQDDDVTRACRDMLDAEWYKETAGDLRPEWVVPPSIAS